VGGGLDPNIEAIVALRPDLVLLATSSPAADRLQALGIKVAALEPKNHADVQRVLLAGWGRCWVSPMRATLAGHRCRCAGGCPVAAGAARGARVYFEVNSGALCGSESSFIGRDAGPPGCAQHRARQHGPVPEDQPRVRRARQTRM
jgi:iron complex transport system substrate-binding protein